MMPYDRMEMIGPDMKLAQTSRSDRWAPWWAYTVPLGALNILRQLLVPPGDVGDVVSVALFLATAATVAVVVTTLHRLVATRPDTRTG
jgi:hypothetical protein